MGKNEASARAAGRLQNTIPQRDIRSHSLKMTTSPLPRDLFERTDSNGSNRWDGENGSSDSSEGSADSFFGSLDREDRRRTCGQDQEEPVTQSDERQERKPQWIQTCNVHKGEWVDVSVRLPDPCPQCKQADGHGQKGRVFETPDPNGKEGDHILFDREFTKQKRSRGASLKHLNPFRN